MQKLIPFVVVALTSVVALVACPSGSNQTACQSDDDCASVPDTPTCDVTAGFCIAGECESDQDCQIKDGADGDTCDATSDCADGEVCVEGFNGDGFCLVTAAEAAECDLIDGFTFVEAPEKGGSGDVGACMSDTGTCSGATCE